MALYGKASAERHTDAINALESCLSASHMDIKQPYKLRLEPFHDDILEILDMFAPKDDFGDALQASAATFDHTAMMKLVVQMFDGEYFTGFQINANQALIEKMRKRIKGKLMFTRSLLADKDVKPGTAKKNLAKFRLNEQENV
jgi:hypothetical protein